MKSKPSLTRSQQLDKLFAAFGISKENAKEPVSEHPNHRMESHYFVSGRSKSMNRIQYIKTLTNFEYFSTGEFIEDIEKENYQPFREQIISSLKKFIPEQIQSLDEQPLKLSSIFHNLYGLRLGFHLMAKINKLRKNKTESSTKDKLVKKLTTPTDLTELDEILCILIDPEKRSFSEGEIDYHDQDYTIIDKEWEDKLPFSKS